MIHDFATIQNSLPEQPGTREPLPKQATQGGLVARAWRFRRVFVLAIILVVTCTFGYRKIAWQQVTLEPQSASTAFESSAPASSANEPVLPVEVERAAKVETVEIEMQNEESFGFYESLQASPWNVPVQRGIYITEEDRKRRSYKYSLQAASMRSERDAKRLVGLLQSMDLPATYSVSDSGYGNIWYRVNVGPFSNVSKMNKAEDILVARGMMPLKRRLK